MNVDSREKPRVLLVGAGEELYLGELGRLADTLGLEVVGRLEQSRRDGAGYLGKGKRKELAEIVEKLDAEIVLTDDELTASQARILEKDSGASVVDRTELIIRIFEEHARDRASRLEVELADLEYRLPRVKGRNPALSRLGGGVGGGRITRGPGEQQLEYERRTIRERMDKLRRRLEGEKSSREVRGARLRESGPPTVALLGYTNAGKTTILNALSSDARSTKDRLFETLETASRLVEGRGWVGEKAGEKNGASGGVSNPDFVVTDTVGFIRKLPTQLVHSFASTLEAARDSDIRVICADASSPDISDEIQTVRETLSGSRPNLEEAPEILCLNKTDLVSARDLDNIRSEYPDAVLMSAKEDAGPLLERVRDVIASLGERMEILIPHSEYAEVSRLYGKARIHTSRDTEEGAILDVTIPESYSGRYSRYRLPEKEEKES